jgi:DNA-binding MarR family transcriptional regulator
MDRSTEEFLKTLHKFRFLKNRIQAGGPLSYAEHFMIATISECMEGKDKVNEGNKGITVSEIAHQLGATMAAVSKMLRSLENKGLITRETSESDRRNVYVRLSEKGMKEQKEQVIQMQTMVDRVIKKMDVEDAKHLNELFKKFYEATKEVIEEG